MEQHRTGCNECGWSCKSCTDQASLHLHVEIENLKQRLLEREHHIVTMETNFLTEAEKFPNGEFAALTEELLTWQEKYSRLYESHKRVQKVNQSLEDKLLRIVDKCETEKNSLTREVSSLTQKLVEAKDKIHWLQDDNERYRNDVNLAIQLLQCKPANFVSQKYDTLPADLQLKVRTYISNKRRSSDGNGVASKPEMKTIKVPIPTFPPTAMVYSVNKAMSEKEDNLEDKISSNKPPVDIVSAAIMAKVLEERERERLHTKHCSSCSCPTGGISLVEKATQTSESQVDSYVKGLAESSNRGSQGLVRYVDVVATRSSDVVNRSMQLEDRCMDMTQLFGASGLKQDPPLLQAKKLDSHKFGCTFKTQKQAIVHSENIAVSQLQSVLCKNNDNHSINLGDVSLTNDGRNLTLHDSKNNDSDCANGKTSDFMNLSPNCNNGSIDKSAKGLYRNSEGGKKGSRTRWKCDKSQIGSVLNSENLAVSSELVSSGSSRVKSCVNVNVDNIGKCALENSGRVKNQEGRTFLSDVANVGANKTTDISWVKFTGETLTKVVTDKKSLNEMSCTTAVSKAVDKTGQIGLAGNLKSPENGGRASSSAAKHRDKAELTGPRPCSMRVQAGTSNILLDNATSYSPVLYTSRHSAQQEVSDNRGSSRNGVAILVHVPRSRSTSVSSVDADVQQIKSTHWESPTETEI